MAWSNDEMRGGELVCGLLEREETPPSMQALGSEMIGRRRSAPEQKRYPAWTSNKAVMVNNLSVLNWNETAAPSGARPN
jgi:hypothetical protein